MIRTWATRVFAALSLLSAIRVTWIAIAYFEGGRLTRYRLEAAWIAFVVFSVLWLASSGALIRTPAESDSKHAFGGLPLLAAFLVGSVVLYWPAIQIGLLSDDFSLLSLDLASILLGASWEHYRPLPLMLWKVLLPIGGAPVLHGLNVVLHGANAWLATRLACQLGQRFPLAPLVGVVFLTFPAAVEPVAWASGIFDVALVTFGLLYLHASMVNGKTWPQMLWLIAALLSKETAVALPLAAAALRLGVRQPVLPLLPSGAVTVFYIGARMSFGLSLPAATAAPLRYMLKELVSRPFASLTVPYTGSELASHPLLLGVAGSTVIAAMIWLYCAKPFAGVRPFALSSVVIIGILPLWWLVGIGENLDGSRYLYLPLVGWSLFVVGLAAHESEWRRHACASALVITFIFPGAWYVRQHLKSWRQAAVVRDTVLRSATQALEDSKCPSAHFRNVPDSQGGVYVFRNGFSEALHGRAVAAGGIAPPACEFSWATDHFTRSH